MVFGPASRPIDVGMRRRLFAGATRRAVEVRDQGCRHPSCDEPAERCQVDHVLPWAAGGPTTIANGRLACGPHNRPRNRRGPPGQDE
ncbi:MAG TPA: HNH endonuclease signature motif containing protein [Acidimicrobiales bacterium]|nr:HNH endonuclease signature motif containing protein [Acidimicrobiales bacterium]